MLNLLVADMRVLLIRGYRSNKKRHSWKTDSFKLVSLVFMDRFSKEEFISLQKLGVIQRDPDQSSTYSEFLVQLTDNQILDAYIESKVLSEGCFKNRKDLSFKSSYNSFGNAEFVSHVLKSCGLVISKDSPYDTPSSICKYYGLTEVM